MRSPPPQSGSAGVDPPESWRLHLAGFDCGDRILATSIAPRAPARRGSNAATA